MDRSLNESNSSESVWPKVEIVDFEKELRRKKKFHWTSDSTMKLIHLLEKECKELWDAKNPFIKDKWIRQTKIEFLSDEFNTTPEEISRKIHNLRTQLNNELRKLKQRQAKGGSSKGSGWEYFDALSFLVRAPSGDPLDTVEAVNMPQTDCQLDEDDQCDSRVSDTGSNPPVSNLFKSDALGIYETVSPPTKIRLGSNIDECQIFGDFVASELRSLSSGESRKKLKRMIQRAILQVEEEEDENSTAG